MNVEIAEALIQKISGLDDRLSRIEQIESVNVIVKTDTGTPATGLLGNLLINTFDNKAYIWADSGWREIASW